MPLCVACRGRALPLRPDDPEDLSRPDAGGFDRITARRFDSTSSAHDGIKARYAGTWAVCGKSIRKGVD